jgi:hypothetical protein
MKVYPNAKHFSFEGAFLEACNSSEAKNVPVQDELACWRLLNQAAEELAVKKFKIQFPEDGLEAWNDTTATQNQIIEVINRAIDRVIAKAPSTIPSSKGPQLCSTQPFIRLTADTLGHPKSRGFGAHP